MALSQLDAGQWQFDLDYLVERLPRIHRNLFHAISPDAFDRAVRALRGRIPTLAAHEVVVEFARLIASIGDGHTTLRLAGVPGFHRYPIEPYLYSDGMCVRAIAREYAHAAGARLVAVGDVPLDEAVAAVRPLVSRDNEMGVIANAPVLLAIPEVLHACGLTADLTQATFTVQLRDGATTRLTLRAAAELPSGMVDARAGATAATPLWLRRPASENWCEYLPEQNVLYVGLNRILDGDRESLAAFFDQIFETIERERVERLILDIRRNHGGNNLLNRDLVHHLIRCDRVNRWGGLFVVIGRVTFSAAMNLAVDLERHTRALFVGEPTGSSPNHYGENGLVALPQSGLDLSVSRLWWQQSVPFDDRPMISPDIPARLSSSDYAANRDPAMEAALQYEPGASQPLDYPDRVFAQLQHRHVLRAANAPDAARHQASGGRA